jgi:hypothetical protein
VAAGTIELLNEDGGATIVLPFDGGDAHEVLRAALARWPHPSSSIYGGSVLDNDRRLLALAFNRNPAAPAAPNGPPLASARTMWPTGAPNRRDPSS